MRNALQELQQIIITPIKAYSPPSAALPATETGSSPSEITKTGAEKESEPFQSHSTPPCDGESSATPISDGDIAGQFTRVMGKGKSRIIWSFYIFYPAGCVVLTRLKTFT